MSSLRTKASVDLEFREVLLRNGKATAGVIDLDLSPSTRAILAKLSSEIPGVLNGHEIVLAGECRSRKVVIPPKKVPLGDPAEVGPIRGRE